MVKKTVDPPTYDELVVDWLIAICKSGVLGCSIIHEPVERPDSPHTRSLDEASDLLRAFVSEEAKRRGIKVEFKP